MADEDVNVVTVVVHDDNLVEVTSGSVELHDGSVFEITEVVRTDVIDVGVEGPTGPPGPTGPTGIQGPVGPVGPDAMYYSFIQNTPLSVWTINHNLGVRPAVTVEDSAGTVVEGDVRYIDGNSVEVTFSAAFSGRADLS